jgi:hypothetical protein
MNQFSLFDAFRAPPILRSIDPDGTVVKGEPRHSFVLPHPRRSYNRCRIELHPSSDDLWMWSVSFHTDGDGCGSSYRVGEKWGQFALTRDDALDYALKELEAKLAEMLLRSPCKSIAKIRAWANSLTLGAVA